MAGGNFTVQNKVRPGAYINVKSAGKALGSMSDRGIVTLPLVLNWGEVKKVITLEPGSDFEKILGYGLLAPELILIRETFKRAGKILLYRVNGGTKATKAATPLTVTAKYEGTRGNDITVKVLADVDVPSSFIVQTYLAGKLVDEQRSKTVEALVANDYVTFSGTGALTANAGIVLAGGTNTQATSSDYSDYFVAVQVYPFNTMALPVDDPVVKGAGATFVKRMGQEEGKDFQVVVADYANADNEGVISVKNGVVLDDGTVLTATQATAWVAGATAGANVNESNTYKAYDGAVDVNIKYTNSQIIEALNHGEWVFVEKDGKAIVEQDINSFTSFDPTKGKEFRKNRCVRVFHAIRNDIKRIFSDYYIGKCDNNEDGRNLFKGECINYFESLQGINAIQNFDASTDIVVSAGHDVDAVVVDAWIQPVDSMEKLYMTVTVK